MDSFNLFLTRDGVSEIWDLFGSLFEISGRTLTWAMALGVVLEDCGDDSD